MVPYARKCGSKILIEYQQEVECHQLFDVEMGRTLDGELLPEGVLHGN